MRHWIKRSVSDGSVSSAFLSKFFHTGNNRLHLCYVVPMALMTSPHRHPYSPILSSKESVYRPSKPIMYVALDWSEDSARRCVPHRTRSNDYTKSKFGYIWMYIYLFYVYMSFDTTYVLGSKHMSEKDPYLVIIKCFRKKKQVNG